MSNLLIIGAGGHGYVIKEIAEATGYYEKIEFVDDDNKIAIGKMVDLETLHNKFDSAFVSIGNCELRNKIIMQLKSIGYYIPVLIHPTSYVSQSAVLGIGTVIEPKAIVNANTSIGEGCIISVGAIVDHNAEIGDFCHINAGAVVKAGTKIESKTKIDAGQTAE